MKLILCVPISDLLRKLLVLCHFPLGLDFLRNSFRECCRRNANNRLLLRFPEYRIPVCIKGHYLAYSK